MKLAQLLSHEIGYWKFFFQKIFSSNDNVDRLCSEWSSINRDSSHISSSAEDPQKILFVTGSLGTNVNALSVESFLIKSLQMRGHECVSLVCNAGLPSCEFNIYGAGNGPDEQFPYALTRPAKRKSCDACLRATHSLMDNISCPTQDLSSYTIEGEVENIWKIVSALPFDNIREFMHQGIRVGDHAFSSTVRITLRGTVDYSNPYELWVYRKQLLSAMLMVDRFNRLLDQVRPNKMVAIHGVYLFHGTAVDVCAQRGIDVVVYGAPYRKNTLFFSHDETYHRSLITEDTKHWESLELSHEMEGHLNTYLDSKTAGGRDNVNYHPNPITEREGVLNAMNINPEIPVVTLFTNVIWDAQIYYNKNAFKDIFDWLYTTIDYFEKRSDVQLVIRVHPAESKGGFTTKQPIEPEINARFPVLPSNVHVIPSQSDISSYTLVDMSKAALIYGTKMGLEIAIRGVPVIVSGETFCRGKGFTYDVDSREQYIDYLNNILNLQKNDRQKIERARKFAYYYFFMRMIDMPLLNLQLANALKEGYFYNFSKLEELLPGRDVSLDVICDGILNQSPFYLKNKH